MWLPSQPSTSLRRVPSQHRPSTSPQSSRLLLQLSLASLSHWLSKSVSSSSSTYRLFLVQVSLPIGSQTLSAISSRLSYLCLYSYFWIGPSVSNMRVYGSCCSFIHLLLFHSPISPLISLRVILQHKLLLFSSISWAEPSFQMWFTICKTFLTRPKLATRCAGGSFGYHLSV